MLETATASPGDIESPLLDAPRPSRQFARSLCDIGQRYGESTRDRDTLLMEADSPPDCVAESD